MPLETPRTSPQGYPGLPPEAALHRVTRGSRLAGPNFCPGARAHRCGDPPTPFPGLAALKTPLSWVLVSLDCPTPALIAPRLVSRPGRPGGVPLLIPVRVSRPVPAAAETWARDDLSWTEGCWRGGGRGAEGETRGMKGSAFRGSCCPLPPPPRLSRCG